MTHSHTEEAYSKTIFGFWLYILTDFMLFATLFAAYAVLRDNTFGGPGGKELFDIPLVVNQSLVLLVSAFTIGIASTFAHRHKKEATIIWLLISFILGLIFLVMGYNDMVRITMSGNGMDRNAFTTAYFTLVGTHWFHLVFAILWVIVFLLPIFRFGIDDVSIKRITCLKMFWQFINVVWIFIFTIVYLVGVK